jgi:hypothetical protein
MHFCLDFALFWAVFCHFWGAFYDPSKMYSAQSKWVSLACLPENGTPHPPILRTCGILQKISFVYAFVVGQEG